MDVNNIVDLAPFGLMLAAVIGAVVGYLRLRSQVVLINPDTLIKQEQRINDAFDRLDEETEKRRATDRELASVKHDYRVGQHRMEDMERQLAEQQKQLDWYKVELEKRDKRIEELMEEYGVTNGAKDKGK